MKTLKNLNHTKVDIQGGGHIIVLNTGAIINPEAEAMLQALHSRSTKGLEGHLKVLEKRGAENFMKNFYVGYGHKSIGDCGTTTIFVEGVSMLVAKAIQDWPLYSGQESSTRYVDFEHLPFKNPTEKDLGDEILERWRTFYSTSMPKVRKALKKRFPRQDGEEEAIYEKAINARAFDILRGFLPAGATTNLAWHTNLRQAADKLQTLHHHPLLEVRRVAHAIEEALKQAHPNSFDHKRYEATEDYSSFAMDEYYYHNEYAPEFAMMRCDIDVSELLYSLLKRRPAKTELPKWLAEAGMAQFEFLLDFGSFRDIQRHRAVTQRMPLLTTKFGFHPWYLNELPEDVRKEVRSLVAVQEDAIAELNASVEIAQYYIAMGYLTSNRVTGTLPALVYLAELRATRFVHPTLRERAIQIAGALQTKFEAAGLVLHLDDEPDRFDTRRGEHDIVLK